MTDLALKGISYIKSLPTEQLKLALIPQSPEHTSICQHVGPGTNPSWVTARIADELQDRNSITDQAHDYFCR